jgi:hypothetical protein
MNTYLNIIIVLLISVSFINQNFIPSNSNAIFKRYYHKNEFFLNKIEEPRDTNIDKNQIINCQYKIELYKKAYELIKDTDIVVIYFNDYMINRDSLNICVSPRIYNRIESLFFIDDIIEIEFNELSDSCKYLKKRELILEEYNNSNETEKYKKCEKITNINLNQCKCDLILFFENIDKNKFRSDLFILYDNENDDYFSIAQKSPIFMEFLFYYDNNNINKLIIKKITH